ncbi:MAG: PucR family transcriptional regulator [Clostridiales bacterium]|nr:PucR family transcriptional regulator [Clostridiales bacterium]
MPVFVRDLYWDTRQQYKIKLIAGGNGMDRIVNWFYIAEDINNTAFLEEDELVISTGFASSLEENWLLTFVKAMIEKETSGLILNTGKYIMEEDIPAEVTALCDRCRFPLLTVPWEIHLSNLTQTYCNRIFAYREQKYNIENAFLSILREDELPQRAAKLLESYSCTGSDSYAMAIISADCPAETLDQCERLLRRTAAFCPSGRNLKFVLFEYQNQFIIVWHNAAAEAVETHAAELLTSCKAIPALPDIHIGLSQTRTGLEFKKIYRQASAALTVVQAENTAGASPALERRSGNNRLLRFDDLGCFSVLLEARDCDTLREYYRRRLGTLEDYDASHGGNYLETLEAYLKYDRHLAKAAGALSCHRNTVNYRINKIRELLDLDFDDGNEIFQLQLALQIRSFLLIFSEKQDKSAGV